MFSPSSPPRYRTISIIANEPQAPQEHLPLEQAGDICTSFTPPSLSLLPPPAPATYCAPQLPALLATLECQDARRWGNRTATSLSLSIKEAIFSLMHLLYFMFFKSILEAS